MLCMPCRLERDAPRDILAEERATDRLTGSRMAATQNTTFQSSFMLTTVHPFDWASAIARSAPAS